MKRQMAPLIGRPYSHCNVDVDELLTSLMMSHPLAGWGAGPRVFGSGALAPLVLGALVGRTDELPLRFLGRPRVDAECPHSTVANAAHSKADSGQGALIRAASLWKILGRLDWRRCRRVTLAVLCRLRPPAPVLSAPKPLDAGPKAPPWFARMRGCRRPLLRRGGRAAGLLRRIGGLGEGRSGVRTCGGPKARGDRIPGACRVTRVAHSTDGALAGRGSPAMRVKAITEGPMRAHGHNTTRAPDRRSARSHQTRQCTVMSNPSRQRPIAPVPRPPGCPPWS